MSGWVSPHPPCTKSDPTWGGEVGGENGRPPPPQSGWCFVEASISGQSQEGAADGRSTLMLERILDPS